jgi:hypothetical protein
MGRQSRSAVQKETGGTLRTGGALTAASHVIDFDRWWNPAVENQAVDPASALGSNTTYWCTSSSAVATSKDYIDQ